MPGSFNPYREWLGRNLGPAAPDYYSLLGVGRDASRDEVKKAADKAINRVRSARPGDRAAAWSKLIDELRTAQSVLNDPQRRAAYDAKLGGESPARETPAPAAQPSPQATPQPASSSYSAPAYADPMAPVSPNGPSAPAPSAPQQPATPAYHAAPAAAPGRAIPFARPVGVSTASPEGPAPSPGYYHPPTAPVVMPVSPGSGGAQSMAPYMAAPVTAPVASVHPAATVHPAASVYPAAPSSEAPSPVPAVKPARRSRRRSRSWMSAVVIAVLCAGLVGSIVAVLYVGLNEPRIQDTIANGGVVQGSSSQTRTPAGGGGRERPRPSFIPPAKTEMPALPTQSQDDDTGAPGEVDPAPPMSEAPAASPPSSVPSTQPEPPPPAARPEPTEEEKAQTARALEAALGALREQNFDAADAQLAQVEALPKTEEDEARFAGAGQLARSARTFSESVREGFAALKPEQQVSFNNTTVKVIETSPESVSIEVVPGLIRKYTPDTLPLGLKYGLVNVAVPPDDPANPLAKAAYHATHPEGDAAELRHFLDEAAAAGADVSGVRLVLNASPAPTTVAATPEPAAPAAEPPSPSAPASMPAPTSAELQELTRLAQTARVALSERNLDEADELIAQAQAKAKLGEHKAKLQGLQQLSYYTREFWRAVDESLTGLAAVGELKVNETVVSVVEAAPNRLVIRVAGERRQYSRKEMPAGLAMAVADHWLNQGEAATLATKGALYAVEKKGDPAKARQLWEQAGQMGLDTSPLLTTLDEDYDFTKEAQP